MAIERDHASESLLDDWIAEVGEAGVLAVIEETRRRVADGSLPSFTDAPALHAYWEARHASMT